MKNSKQKLFAILMMLSFMISSLPSLAVTKASTTAVTPAKSTQSAPKSIPLKSDTKIKNASKKMSISLRDSDVMQTLRMFADKAGLNIIFHSSVQGGTITLDLVGVTFEDALRMIMQATDLAYYIDGQTIIIMSAEASQQLNITKQNMIVLPVKYADATEIAEFLNKNVFTANKPGLSNTQIVSVNPVKNELLIFGTQSDYNMAKKIVDLMDEPTRVTTYKVNHVTPREMANNICKALVKNFTEEEEDNSDEEDDDEEDDDSSSGSAGGGTSASSLSAAATSKVKLGEMKIACVAGNVKEREQESKPLEPGAAPYSVNQNSMKIMYLDTLGTITVVGGSVQQLETISAFISANDIKQPMAYLELSIIELNEEGSKDFQNNWEFLTNNISLNFMGGALYSEKALAWVAPGKAPEGSITINQYFRYQIENKKGKVMANPKIMVTSGKESIIDLSEDYVRKSTVQTTSGTSTYSNMTYDIGKDAGIVVRLTPFISRDGYVTLNLAPNYAIAGKPLVQYTEKGEEYIAATLLTRRNLELKNVRVKDGDTLVIGGLIKEEDTKSEQKIPLLGDIPVVGFFFRNTSTTRKKTELVILVTPHIIQDSIDIVQNDTKNL